jgi:hypothetical protein
MPGVVASPVHSTVLELAMGAQPPYTVSVYPLKTAPVSSFQQLSHNQSHAMVGIKSFFMGYHPVQQYPSPKSTRTSRKGSDFFG